MSQSQLHLLLLLQPYFIFFFISCVCVHFSLTLYTAKKKKIRFFGYFLRYMYTVDVCTYVRMYDVPSHHILFIYLVDDEEVCAAQEKKNTHTPLKINCIRFTSLFFIKYNNACACVVCCCCSLFFSYTLVYHFIYIYFFTYTIQSECQSNGMQEDKRITTTTTQRLRGW